MQRTVHATQRMAQRGITGVMVDLALEWGEVHGDKCVLDRSAALARLDRLKQEQKALLRVIDKGGVVVVTEGESIITTYNCNG